MQIVIPMAGRGARFQRAGFRAIKPLIEVDGRPMIEHVVGMFPPESRFVFICAEDHLATHPLEEVLLRLAPEARIEAIAPHKLGPVHTVLEGLAPVVEDEPVFLSYCDYGQRWDFHDFERHVHGYDGAITAYRGFHPHSLGPNLYAYLRESGGELLEIREKGCFTRDRMQEYASAGGYYFGSGALMRKCFEAARDRGMTTHGEFYASTPFNILVEEGRRVLVHEIERFLQWGTPEDLEEYQGWSDYFRQFAAKTADEADPASPGAGTTLLPMAGLGERFSRVGYTTKKPLIPVAKIPMVKRALTSLPQLERTLAVCLEADLADGALATVLEDSVAAIEILSLDAPTEGQAATCLRARDRVTGDQPLLIAACDTELAYDTRVLDELIARDDVDGVVWTFRDHPHANRHPKQYGWVRTSEQGDVQEVSCKVPLHEDVSGDPGITGIFWFRRADDFFEAAAELVRRNLRARGEFYVDDVIGVAARSGLRMKVFDVDHYISMGTPDDVETYEYWESYFNGTSRPADRRLRSDD